MGSPLDDLRNMSNQINRKKAESEEKTKIMQKQEREQLSRKSLDQQQQRKELSKKTAKQAKKMKTGVVVTLASVIIFLLFFIIQYIYSSMTASSGPVTLLSDNFTPLSNSDERYPELFSFARKVIISAGEGSDIKADRWYKALSSKKQERFENTLKQKAAAPEMIIQDIKYNDKSEIFEVQGMGSDKTELTLDIIYDMNNKLKIVKVL
jgi:hypothetical protein